MSDEKKLEILTPVILEPEVVPGVPAPVLPRVGIEVFCKVSGLKADQLAGFRQWVKLEKLAPRSIPEWREELTRYSSRPV